MQNAVRIKSNLICRQLIFEFFHLALCVMDDTLGSVDCLHSVLLQQQLPPWHPLTAMGNLQKENRNNYAKNKQSDSVQAILVALHIPKN